MLVLFISLFLRKQIYSQADDYQIVNLFDVWAAVFRYHTVVYLNCREICQQLLISLPKK